MRRDTRKAAILATIIEQYIRSGQPAASSLVAQESRLGLSPASVRSLMASLTEDGYLEQPHISAGRIPTAKGFRLYIDTVLAPRPLPKAQKEALTHALGEGNADISQILRRASAMVANHSLQLGLVLAPKANEMRWRTIDFTLAGPNLVLAVLILDGGSVRTRMVAVPTPYSVDELLHCSNYLNSTFTGCTLSEARARIEKELELAGEKLEEMCRNALTLSRPALAEADGEREFFMDGIGQVSHSSAFADTARLRELLSFMEERPKILDLLERTMASSDISVSFVQGEYDTGQWAVVSAPYASQDDEEPLGVVSAVGLLQMNYAMVLPVVGAVAASVAAIMRDRL